MAPPEATLKLVASLIREFSSRDFGLWYTLIKVENNNCVKDFISGNQLLIKKLYIFEILLKKYGEQNPTNIGNTKRTKA